MSFDACTASCLPRSRNRRALPGAAQLLLLVQSACLLTALVLVLLLQATALPALRPATIVGEAMINGINADWGMTQRRPCQIAAT